MSNSKKLKRKMQKETRKEEYWGDPIVGHLGKYGKFDIYAKHGFT